MNSFCLEKALMGFSSTTVGSIARAHVYEQTRSPAYKITKAALNMLSVQYAQQYASEGFTFLLVSPGVSCVPGSIDMKVRANLFSGCKLT
jgi:NAD(P)-dependent dehydrogenase (short-subunit alcohol dehydrogenase family)